MGLSVAEPTDARCRKGGSGRGTAATHLILWRTRPLSNRSPTDADGIVDVPWDFRLGRGDSATPRLRSSRRRSSSSSSQGALDARPTASASSLVKPVTRYPLKGDSPLILVASSKEGAVSLSAPLRGRAGIPNTGVRACQAVRHEPETEPREGRLRGDVEPGVSRA